MRRSSFALGLLVAAAGGFTLRCSSGGSGAAAPDGGAPEDGGTLDGSAGQQGDVQLSNLSGPVEVIRDKAGTIHIYATTAADAVRVQGYQTARDRTAQLELLRRSAEGRLAEVAGSLSPTIVDRDIAIRTLGLNRTAKASYDALPSGSEAKAWLDAYADGVTQFNARVVSGAESLPAEMVGIPETAFEPWTGADVLAVGRYQVMGLAYSAVDEIAETQVVAAARALFSATSGDPAMSKRAGFLTDLLGFAPLDPTFVLDGFPNDAPGGFSKRSPARAPRPSTHGGATSIASPALLATTQGWQKAQEEARAALGDPSTIGSNNWAVMPSRTATGHAMLASDPHLALTSPAVFMLIHMSVTATGADHSGDFDASGVAFPGLPGTILGFNHDVAWSGTNAFFDVTDVYQETLSADGKSVVFQGANVPLETIHETIKISGQPPLEYDVLNVPHHGPIVPTIVDHKVVPPDPKLGALSTKWMGTQPSVDLATTIGFMRAKSVDDARAALQSLSVGAQNWVFADTAGNIGYSARARIPMRPKAAFTWDPATFTGTLPCFVLPGDGSAEWLGDLPDAFAPRAKNPQRGYIATANGDPVGVTRDGDPSNDALPDGTPVYIGAIFDVGFRVGRIGKRIEQAGHPLTLDDLASIQADTRSETGARLGPKIVEALAAAEAERTTPGSHPDLTALVADPRYAAAKVPDVLDAFTRWGTDADYDTPAGVDLDTGAKSDDAKVAVASKATLLFNAWLVRMLGVTLDDELNAIGFYRPDNINLRKALIHWLVTPPEQLATYDATTKDSALFDDLTTPLVTETRTERIVTAMLDAVALVDKTLGSDRDAWRWGTLHTVQLASPVSIWPSLSIPVTGDPVFPRGFPRPGDGFTVDVGALDYRPATFGAVSFTYTTGPAQRFVIDMDPAGPSARNVIPGGAVWDSTSPHFRDQADLWRKNQSLPLPFARAEVFAATEKRTVFAP